MLMSDGAPSSIGMFPIIMFPMRKIRECRELLLQYRTVDDCTTVVCRSVAVSECPVRELIAPPLDRAG